MDNINSENNQIFVGRMVIGNENNEETNYKVMKIFGVVQDPKSNLFHFYCVDEFGESFVLYAFQFQMCVTTPERVIFDELKEMVQHERYLRGEVPGENGEYVKQLEDTKN